MQSQSNDAIDKLYLGFMYAGIAGFRVDLLVGNQEASKDFFNLWMRWRSDKKPNPSYPAPDKRSALLQKRLRILADRLMFFQYGVRLAHFNRYEEALYFFEETRKDFPSREVLNNLGYCYLQMAMKLLPSNQKSAYWIPTLLELRSRADELPFRSKSMPEKRRLSADCKDKLNTAVGLFRQAIDADESYWPAHLNLSIAQFYLERYRHAFAVIGDAKEIDPENGQILTMEALIISRMPIITKRLSVAIKQLEDIVADSDDLCARYNLAVLYVENGETDNARQTWNQLAGRIEELSPTLQKNVIFNVDDPLACQKRLTLAQKKNSYHGVKWPWPIPMAPGTDVCEDKKAAKELNGWGRIIFDWQRDKLKGRMLTKAAGTGILEMDGFVEMVVLRGDDLGTPADLAHRLPPLLADLEASGGRLLYFGQSCTLRLIDDRIMEVWLVRQPGGA